MSSAADTLDAWVDAHFDDEVRVPAGAGARADRHAAGRQRAARRSARRAARRLRLRRRDATGARRAVREHGLASITNLVVRRRYGDGPTIALNAHGDVVPPGEGWSHDPYGGEVDAGRLYGRAAAVSKSDFATYAFAVRALDARRRLAGAVELHFTYDEEFGGELGPAGCCSRACQARPADRRRLQLPGRDRAQRLPAARGHGARQDGARRDPGSRRRRAAGRVAILNALYAQNATLPRRDSGSPASPIRT
jgi:hypothetical protein